MHSLKPEYIKLVQMPDLRTYNQQQIPTFDKKTVPALPIHSPYLSFKRKPLITEEPTLRIHMVVKHLI